MNISIHALLAESDRGWTLNINGPIFLSTLSLRRATPALHNILKLLPISIHALLAESDLLTRITGFLAGVFLSTLSLRRATVAKSYLLSVVVYFYPRSPCGERLMRSPLAFVVIVFLSTLSLRRATTDMRQRLIEFRFLSTLSLRRATRLGLLGWLRTLISIHALLAESDNKLFQVLFWQSMQFLSTLSLRRATLRKVPILGIK